MQELWIIRYNERHSLELCVVCLWFLRVFPKPWTCHEKLYYAQNVQYVAFPHHTYKDCFDGYCIRKAHWESPVGNIRLRKREKIRGEISCGSCLLWGRPAQVRVFIKFKTMTQSCSLHIVLGLTQRYSSSKCFYHNCCWNISMSQLRCQNDFLKTVEI